MPQNVQKSKKEKSTEIKRLREERRKENKGVSIGD